jgi:DegV family protein with EDD domain
MNDYTIITDSSCDLPAKIVDDLGIQVMPLSVVTETGKRFVNYLDEREISTHDFYNILRQKIMATTAAPNLNAFMELMEPLLQAGQDILYIGFSSTLSSTYSAGVMATTELREKYPDRKIYTVDSLCASMGQGLLVYLTAMEKKKGSSIKDTFEFAEDLKHRICHWFTLESLQHLRRGGRLSATSAVVGTVLNIKPVLHMDKEGRLVNVEKVRSRGRSLRRIVQIMRETAVNLSEQTVFISHGDCLEEAEEVASMIRAAGAKNVLISYVGPVIGSHTGPGVIAIFYIGKGR